ncbi:DUF4097 family beta strand repeat-containing protein [uncultured Ferrimonas sp.]|uniref:DUF4097 family beta strand repeat-containing protein n=1 Tax=uncultured Ferrimonas sp. TaxID=432640 RepID=UPI002627F50D|nr:DUF4097 family beta strand repeat-containing protein [uncultured Ferrimonas sp.]
MKLTALAALTLLAPSSLWAQTIDQSLTWATGSTIVIELPRGDLQVRGSDSQQINVSGQLDDDTKAFIFEQRGDELLIEVKLPKQWSSHQDKNKQYSDLVITLPQQAGVEIEVVSTDVEINQLTQLALETVSGDIKVTDGQGQFEIDAVSGDVRLANLSGELDIEAVSGDISANNCQGEIELSTVSGDANAQQLSGKLTLESVSGDVNIDADELVSLQGRSVSGDVKIEADRLAARIELELETVSGDVTLQIDQLGDVNVSAHAGGGGSIRNDWSEHRASKSKYGGNKSLQFGNGPQQVRLNTVSGDLNLRK